MSVASEITHVNDPALLLDSPIFDGFSPEDKERLRIQATWVEYWGRSEGEKPSGSYNLDTTYKSSEEISGTWDDPDDMAPYSWPAKQWVVIQGYKTEGERQLELVGDQLTIDQRDDAEYHARRCTLMANAIKRLLTCGQVARLQWRDCGHDREDQVRSNTWRCGVQGCQSPGCQGSVAARKGTRLQKQIESVIPKKKKKWTGRDMRLWTATTRTGVNAGDPVDTKTFEETAARVWAAWGLMVDAMRDHDDIDRYGRKSWGGFGEAAALEFGASGMCHLHAIVWGPKYPDFGEWQHRWRLALKKTGCRDGNLQISKKPIRGRTTKDGVELTAVESATREVAKYVSKPMTSDPRYTYGEGQGGLKKHLEVTVAACTSARNKRFLRQRGSFYGTGAGQLPTCPPCEVCGCTVSAGSSPVTLSRAGTVSETDQRRSIDAFKRHKIWRENYPRIEPAPKTVVQWDWMVEANRILMATEPTTHIFSKEKS